MRPNIKPNYFLPTICLAVLIGFIVLGGNKKKNHTSPTIQPSVPLIKPTLKPSPAKTANTGFIYPNSVIIKSEDNDFILESNDNSDAITSWYSDKIKSAGMNATSFVKTSTNNNILNMLEGTNGQRKIKVTITRKENQPKVTIEVSL